MQPINIFIQLSFSKSSISIFLVFLLLLGDHGEARVNLPRNVTVPAAFMFGDSNVDQGTNNYLHTIVKANFAPYGKDFASGKPTGRFTNNKTPADFLVEGLGIKDLMPPYRDPSLDDKELLTGVSFGSAGSGYDPRTSKSLNVLSMTDQLNDFKDYIQKVKGMVGEEKTQDILANSVFMVMGGSDDLLNSYFNLGTRKLQYDYSTYVDLMVSSVSNFIQELYKLGARRIGVFSIPALGCAPSQITAAGDVLIRECVEKLNQASQLYNSKLHPTIEYLNSTLEQSRIVYIDFYNPLLDMIKNPLQYGLEVVDRGCCGTGDIEVGFLCNRLLPTCHDNSIYLFWDTFHLTNKGYKIIMYQALGKHINDFF